MFRFGFGCEFFLCVSVRFGPSSESAVRSVTGNVSAVLDIRVMEEKECKGVSLTSAAAGTARA